jgi:hypothetical protein
MAGGVVQQVVVRSVMADISIQFHAVSEELLDFVKAIVNDFGLHIVAMKP